MQRSGIDAITSNTSPETPYGKVTKNTWKPYTQEIQEVSPFPARNRQDRIIKTNVKRIHKRSTALDHSVNKSLEGLNMFNGTNITFNSDVDQDT